MYHFNDVIGDSRFTMIYPIRQRAVQIFVDSVLKRHKDAIDKIIVFGSCVTLRCGTESDVDIAIISDTLQIMDLHGCERQKDMEYDIIILTNQQYDEACGINDLYVQIKGKGAVVYERISKADCNGHKASGAESTTGG